MRILHTSDWHVGKVLKGRDRHDEHVAVLGSIVRAARDEDVDGVLVAGALFETAAPSPKAQGLGLPTGAFTAAAVNVVMAHVTLLGGRGGGGERGGQSTLDYELPARMFPATAHYAALGHLHRHQEIPAACPAYYSGSPLAIDFGEEANESVALIVTAAPGIRADVRPVPLAGGRPLRTLRGTLDEVIAAGEHGGDSYLRLVLAEPGRAGLGGLVRGKRPKALEGQLDG